MIKIITAMNNPNLNEELKNENNIKIIGRDIQYKEGILELLENNIEINYIIIDENLPGEIELNKLIENILEKNKKIKIIITIKKENKNKLNLNNKKIIKIYYEKNINLEKLKNYNNYENISEENILEYNIKNKLINKKLNNKKIKNNNSKIINFLGDRQVGKSLTIFNIANFLNNQNYKILIIELNSENQCFKTIFKSKIKIQKNKNKNENKINNFKKIKKLNNKNYKLKYLNEKILNKLIIKINKNMDLIFYNKIINFNSIKKLEKNYNYILIENYFNKNNLLNKKIINNSEKNILIINPNLLGIKNGKKIIEKNKLNKNNNLKILINNYNKNSIDEEIIKNIFKENKIIGKINYEIEYEKIINTNFKNINFLLKKYNENLKTIMDKII